MVFYSSQDAVRSQFDFISGYHISDRVDGNLELVHGLNNVAPSVGALSTHVGMRAQMVVSANFMALEASEHFVGGNAVSAEGAERGLFFDTDFR